MFQSSNATDYRGIFQKRGSLYNAASRLCPAARNVERVLLLRLLDLQPWHMLCDTAAGGGYLTEEAGGLLPRGNIICVDPSMELARGLDARFPRLVASIDRLPLTDGSFDRVSCLTGLHHVDDKSAFFREAYRVLKANGRVAAADVLWDTPPARFLNGPCDRLSSTGHQGKFFAPGEMCKLLEGAGFEQVSERLHEYTWDFPDEDTLIEFCTRLFGLEHGTRAEVREALMTHLKVDHATAEVHLHWALVYASGIRSR